MNEYSKEIHGNKEKEPLKKEDKFIISGEQIILITSVLGEVPAKFAYQALKLFEGLKKVDD